MPGPRPSLVLMGVSAAGKTVVGREVAARAGIPFLDADDLYPAANVQKMAAGIPLDDADRAPWIDAVGAQLAESAPCIMACSALTPRLPRVVARARPRHCLRPARRAPRGA